MNVTVARTAGFCFGVKRAVDRVYELIETEERPSYTYGPIIHNEEVISDLERRGVFAIEEEEPVPEGEKVIVIRAHGVGLSVYERLKAHGCEVVDATCPFVERIHRIVQEESGDGRIILIAGDPKHPEVRGIAAFSSMPVYYLQSAEDVERLPFAEDERISLVAQTTFNYRKFQVLVEKLKEKRYDSRIANTVCNATQERQEEARQIAAVSDVMIVVGGKNSSNTQKLYEICRGECERTYYIQTAEDLVTENLQVGDNVGITAGASTPSNIIEEVKTKCQI